MNPTFLIALVLLAGIVGGILIHKYFPGTTTAKVEAIAGGYVQAVEADLRAAAPKVAAAVAKIESVAETESLSLLERGIAWLVDTSAEDASIAQAQALIAAANDAKTRKAGLLAQHQANVAALVSIKPA